MDSGRITNLSLRDRKLLGHLSGLFVLPTMLLTAELAIFSAKSSMIIQMLLKFAVSVGLVKR